ncbi:MarC family protein [Apibacter sp. HY039]|uniref:MarC family protein n=1 Tax=Apibacter sp. HY039 TaxID=2501476 RepID=UPI000FEC0BC5|nr:MarC family protein [Apibacter sp. HY039]
MVQNFIHVFSAAMVALFPVVNPIGNAFIVNNFLEGLGEKQRKSVVKQITIYCLSIGLGSLLIGRLILLLFGLSIPVIQLGGGLMICKTALGWLSDGNNKGKSKEKKEKTINDLDNENIQKDIFYPITFPIIMGSGSISVIFTLTANSSIEENMYLTLINYLTIALVILVLCILVYFFLSNASKIVDKVGSSGNIIINKLIAFFTFCIGIQITLTGIFKIFHIDIM